MKDTCVIISLCGIILLVINELYGRQARFSLKLSLLRSLRINVGTCAFFCLILIKSTQRHDGRYDDHVQTVHGSGPTFIDGVSWILQLFFGFQIPRTPINYPLTGFLPAVCLSAIAFSLLLSRRCTATVLKLSLQFVLSSPNAAVQFISGIITASMPLIACLIAAALYHLDLPSPVDSAFFLAIIFSGSLLLYFLSLFLCINFRGEFGVLMEESNTASVSSSSQQLTEVFSVPLADIQHIMSVYFASNTGGSIGRGTSRDGKLLSFKIFNLKLDLMKES